MDSFFIEYRDPMFGIIIFFGIIFIVAFMNYWWSIFKSKEEKQSIERFIKRFEVAREQDAYKELLDSFKLSTNSLALLAHSYVKSGDFETAIGIYLIALKQVRGRDEKCYILGELGKAYFKAGFLQRSAEVFLESIKLAPRNKIALKYLTVCYDSLKTYDLALEALNSLEELEVDVKMEKAYIEAKMILNNSKLDINDIPNELEKLQDFPLIYRMIIDFKISHGLIKTQDFDVKEPENVLDLAWFMETDEINYNELSHPIFQTIGYIKGVEGTQDKSRIFELEILGKLKEANFNKATLNFEYACKNCKQTFPVFFYRCPNCHGLASVEIEPILISKNHETHIPFQ